MEANRTALLVMDMEMGILSRIPEKADLLVKKIAGAINAARAKDILILFIRLGFHKGMPEVNPANKMFSDIKSRLNGDGLDSFMQIPAELGILESDIVINKKRVSGFSGSDLDMILRANNISNLVLTGVSTSGVVLSTLTEAFDKDYQLSVLADGCADADEEAHQFLLAKVFPKRASVLPIEEWMQVMP